MELHLSLSLFTTLTKFSDDEFTGAAGTRKRSFSHSNYTSQSYHSDVNETMESPRTLPLFLWSNQEDEDDPKDHSDHSSSSSINQIEEDDGEGIVGWPPIKFRRRRKMMMRQQNRMVENGRCADCNSRVSNSMYVKVKMEGVAIARKIDLTIFNSFQHLQQILIHMFGIFEENSASYKLTYQNKEGDWLLAENVSWRSFLGSVQRLKLIRSSSC